MAAGLYCGRPLAGVYVCEDCDYVICFKVVGGKCLMDEVEDEGRCVKGFLGCVFGNGIGYKWEI